MAYCKYCGTEKSESEFNLNSNGKIRRICKPCHKERYYTYKKRPPEYWMEKRAEAKKARELKLALLREEKRLEKEAQKEKRKEARKVARKIEKKRYRERNPIEHLVRRNNWKARKAGVNGCITISGIKNIIQSNGMVCNICGVELSFKGNLNIDHIIPKCKGGENLDHNIQLLCAQCNTKKGKTLPSPKAETVV